MMMRRRLAVMAMTILFGAHAAAATLMRDNETGGNVPIPIQYYGPRYNVPCPYCGYPNSEWSRPFDPRHDRGWYTEGERRLNEDYRTYRGYNGGWRRWRGYPY
jgi:hypothetical protein